MDSGERVAVTHHADTIRRLWRANEYDDAATESFAAAVRDVERMEAELRQAQEERDRFKHERDTLEALRMEEHAAQRQAIDALREIERALTATADARIHRPSSIRRAKDIARAALVELGEAE